MVPRICSYAKKAARIMSLWQARGHQSLNDSEAHEDLEKPVKNLQVGTGQSSWASSTCIIPTDITHDSKSCRRLSQYFCILKSYSMTWFACFMRLPANKGWLFIILKGGKFCFLSNLFLTKNVNYTSKTHPKPRLKTPALTSFTTCLTTSLERFLVFISWSMEPQKWH